MEVLPSQSEVFLPENTEQQLPPDAPTLVASDGSRPEIPPRVFEAIEFLEAASSPSANASKPNAARPSTKCSPNLTIGRTTREPNTLPGLIDKLATQQDLKGFAQTLNSVVDAADREKHGREGGVRL